MEHKCKCEEPTIITSKPGCHCGPSGIYRYVDLLIGKDSTLVHPKVLGWGPDEANAVRVTVLKQYRTKICQKDIVYVEFKDVNSARCYRTPGLEFVNWVAEVPVPKVVLKDPTSTVLVQVVVEDKDTRSLLYRSKVYSFGVGDYLGGGDCIQDNPGGAISDLERRVTLLEQFSGAKTYVFKTDEEARQFIVTNPYTLDVGDVFHITDEDIPDGWWNGSTIVPYKSNISGEIPESDKTAVIKQLSPSSVWTIAHTLNKFPSVTVVDSGGNVVIGDITYVDMNTIIINFTTAFSGKVYLN